MAAERKALAIEEITGLQQMKTADMIVTSAMEIGAIIAGETPVSAPFRCAPTTPGSPSRSPTTFSMPRPRARRSARPPARTPSRARPPSSPPSASMAPEQCSTNASATRWRLLDDFGPSAERLRDVIRFFATREN
jgi:hypothetical protein